MKTFTRPKEFTENSHYKEHRRKCLRDFSNDVIDLPIIDIINIFNKLPNCFTMQSCYGHFLYIGQRNPHNLEPLPISNTITRVEYRIAYVAFCIENCDSGRLLLEALKKLTIIDQKNIQFCCAEWFWKRQVNSYVLQVAPERFKNEDKIKFDYMEAMNLEKTRNTFFVKLNELLQKQQNLMKPASTYN